MVETEMRCSECGHTPREETKFCPECGAETPWLEEPVADFNDVDFPVFVEMYESNDNWELWREFCDTAFGNRSLKGEHIANLPDGFGRELKYAHYSTWWVVTETSVDGPYLTERAARESVEPEPPTTEDIAKETGMTASRVIDIAEQDRADVPPAVFRALKRAGYTLEEVRNACQ